MASVPRLPEQLKENMTWITKKSKKVGHRFAPSTIRGFWIECRMIPLFFSPQDLASKFSKENFKFRFIRSVSPFASVHFKWALAQRRQQGLCIMCMIQLYPVFVECTVNCVHSAHEPMKGFPWQDHACFKCSAAWVSYDFQPCPLHIQISPHSVELKTITLKLFHSLQIHFFADWWTSPHFYFMLLICCHQIWNELDFS